jgi:hypothetical protein
MPNLIADGFSTGAAFSAIDEVLQKIKSAITKLKMKSGLNIFAIIFPPFLFFPSIRGILTDFFKMTKKHNYFS